MACSQEFLGSRWPEELGEDWKQLSLDFQAKTHEVALKLLRAVAITLGRDEHYFDEVSLSVQLQLRNLMHLLKLHCLYHHAVDEPAHKSFKGCCTLS